MTRNASFAIVRLCFLAMSLIVVISTLSGSPA